MGRGRRPRTGAVTGVTSATQPSSLLENEQCCDSPKRKEQRTGTPSKNYILKTVLVKDTETRKNGMNLRNSSRMSKISSYFNQTTEITTANAAATAAASSNQINKRDIIDLTDDSTSDDMISTTNAFNSFPTNFLGIINKSENIFLQEPVLKLNVDRSPTQASSILIKKSSFDACQNFGASITLHRPSGSGSDFSSEMGSPLDLSKPTQVTQIDSTTFLNSDSNSCDSGVVIEKAGSDKKPVTPHRILWVSPKKNLIEKSTTDFSQRMMQLDTKNLKSKKRLNVNQSENIPKNQISSNVTPVETQTGSKIATKESHNTTLTSYFHLRRSVRKTKKEVQEEKIKSIEQAIIEGREDGLEVHVFDDKGRGIVTNRPFSKGEYVVEYIGQLISSAEAQSREDLYALDQNTGCYMYYFKHKNQQYCIDATPESGKLGRLVNHSRTGNLIPRSMMIKNVPRLVLFAKEDIKAGEEVTYDYGDRSKESLIHHPWLAL